MRIFLLVLTISFSLLMFAVCYIWAETNTISQFTDIFKSFYGGVPVLSSTIFSIGKLWYIAPALCLIEKIRQSLEEKNLRIVTLISTDKIF
jgi:hypothetical protein